MPFISELLPRLNCPYDGQVETVFGQVDQERLAALRGLTAVARLQRLLSRADAFGDMLFRQRVGPQRFGGV